MRRTFAVVKSVSLLAALLIVGWAATSSPGGAEAATCKGAGHSCHGQLADGTIIHSKESAAY